MTWILIFKNKQNNFLILDEDNSNKKLQINFYNKNKTFKIFQDKNLLVQYSNKSSNQIIYKDFNHLYQSEITKNYVLDLIKNGKCELPTIRTSYKLHKLIIEEVTISLSRLYSKKITVAPIT